MGMGLENFTRCGGKADSTDAGDVAVEIGFHLAMNRFGTGKE